MNPSSILNKAVRNPLLAAVAVIGLWPGLSAAEVTGAWNTTGLTRIDVKPIKAKEVKAEHLVEIADGNYSFDNGGQFLAGDVTGAWTQKKTQYSVKVDRLELENQFRTSLEQTGLVVHQVKLLKSKLTGSELDNGIWGSELYEYKIDSSLDGYRAVIRLLMSVNVAGYQGQLQGGEARIASMASAETADSGSGRAPLDLAASAVVRHLSRQATPAR